MLKFPELRIRRGLPPGKLERLVHGDPVQPSSERGATVELIHARECENVRVLGQIEGTVGISRYLQQQPVDVLGRAVVNLTLGRAVTPAAQFRQLLVC
jgi:hypothetical protein